MSKIIVRRQEYANNGTHANEIEAVVKDNLIVNTLSSATDVVPSVGLLKSLVETGTFSVESTQDVSEVVGYYFGKVVMVTGKFRITTDIASWHPILYIPSAYAPITNAITTGLYNNSTGLMEAYMEMTNVTDGRAKVESSKTLSAGTTVYKFTLTYIRN